MIRHIFHALLHVGWVCKSLISAKALKNMECILSKAQCNNSYVIVQYPIEEWEYHGCPKYGDVQTSKHQNIIFGHKSGGKSMINGTKVLFFVRILLIIMMWEHKISCDLRSTMKPCRYFWRTKRSTWGGSWKKFCPCATELLSTNFLKLCGRVNLPLTLTLHLLTRGFGIVYNCLSLSRFRALWAIEGLRIADCENCLSSSSDSQLKHSTSLVPQAALHKLWGWKTDWAMKPGIDGWPNHYRLAHVDWLTSPVEESKTENCHRQVQPHLINYLIIGGRYLEVPHYEKIR